MTASYARYRAIYATLPLASLETIAARDDVDFIDTPSGSAHQKPHASAAPAVPFWANGSFTVQAIAAATAVNDPEGDAVHGAATVRQQYGVNGTGIKVGVISDSIDDNMGSYQAALNNSYLANLTILPGQAGTGTGEGLAMCEAVDRIVPGCQLYFSTDSSGSGGDDEEQMATNIATMVSDGCRIILDDAFYFDENPFQDSGPVAQAVIAASNAGVMYFSCMANYGNEDSMTSSCWEGDFAGTDQLQDGENILTYTTDANGPEELNTVTSGGAVDVYLFWADPSGKVTAHYNLYETDAERRASSRMSDDTGTTDPVQHLKNVAGWRRHCRDTGIRQPQAVSPPRHRHAGVQFHLRHGRPCAGAQHDQRRQCVLHRRDACRQGGRQQRGRPLSGSLHQRQPDRDVFQRRSAPDVLRARRHAVHAR